MYIQNMAFVYEIKIVTVKTGLKFVVFYEDFCTINIFGMCHGSM